MVRLALRLVPMAASTAVMQVPMFWPNRTYTALGRAMTPLMASACKMPTEAEEDWMMAVKHRARQNAQHRVGELGHQRDEGLRIRAGASWQLLIISMPMNRTPRPAMILPKWCSCGFFRQRRSSPRR